MTKSLGKDKVSKSICTRGIELRIAVMGLAIAIMAPIQAIADQQSDMTTMKSRLYNHFLDEGAKSQAEIANILNSQNPNGSWPDINYNDHSRTVWDPANHL